MSLPAERGELKVLGQEMDNDYMARLETLILDRRWWPVKSENRFHADPRNGWRDRKAAVRAARVSVHRAGAGSIRRKFSDREIAQSRERGSAQNGHRSGVKGRRDVVIATDPDCDRMGVAARNRAGEMELFTGNQIGSLMAYYRVRTLFRQGILTEANAKNAVIIKTFVTTDLQKAIAEKHGLRCVETLTGFKYIGEKLGKYEARCPVKSGRNIGS